MNQLSFFPVVQQTSYDWKNHPDPETVFGDLAPGDLFQVIDWVNGSWHVYSQVFKRVEQPNITYPNSIAVERDAHYPYRLTKTSFFSDIPVRRVQP